MPVLILGGTGAIGSFLVDILNLNGKKVFVTTRRNIIDKNNIKYIQGNAHDINFLSRICSQKWDTIIDFMSYKTEEFNERIILLLKSTKHYVYISSARVYADKEHPIKETTSRLLDVSNDKEYLNTDEYALTKARQEDILKRQSVKNYTIVRPYITYGEKRFQLGVLEKEEWLYRALQGRTIVFPKDLLDKRTTMTSGYDVAHFIYKLIENPNVKGKTFHVTNSLSITWKEIINIYKKIIEKETGKKIKIQLVSNDSFLKCRYADLKYQLIYDRLYNRVFDTRKEEKIIDITKFVTIESGLETSLKTFLRAPKYNYINWIYEAKKDRLTNEITPLPEIGGIRNKIKYLIYRYIK